MTTCSLYGCDLPVSNWRLKCCCLSHQRRYAAKQRHGTAHLPNKTKEELAIYYRQYAMEKQIRIKQATPKWANHNAITSIYKEAHRITAETGIKYEVDHIIPLTNKLVCGLHTEDNLQVIEMIHNRRKRNHFKP